MEPVWIGVVASVAGVAVTGISFWIGIAGQITKADAKAEAAKADATAAMVEAKIALAALAEFKERVAREYVAQESLRQMEERLVGALSRLADRLDKLFEPRAPHTRTRAGDLNT